MFENEYVERYLNYMSETLKRDIKTIKEYRDDIKEAMNYLFNNECSIKSIEELTYIDVLEKWLVPIQDKGLKAASINRRISSFRGFLNFLIGLRLINYNAMDYVKNFKDKEQFERTILSDEELIQLLNYTQHEYDENKDYMTARDNLIVNILASTGMRINELRNININDINFVTGELDVVGKRGIKKHLILNEYVLKLYREYLHYRNQCEPKKDHEEALFISRNGNRPTVKTLENVIEKITKNANVTRISPHSFKAKFVTSMHEQGYDLETIGKLTGNKNTQVLYNNYLKQNKPIKTKEIMNDNPIYRQLERSKRDVQFITI